MRAKTLILEHAPNPDIVGGYWEHTVDPRRVEVECESLEEAREEFTKWRDRNGLGGGNLRRATWGKYRFSYNGRAWDNESFCVDCGAPLTHGCGGNELCDDCSEGGEYDADHLAAIKSFADSLEK